MSEHQAIAVSIVVVLIVALLVGVRVWRRDPLLRVVRFGVFLERERFDEDQLEQGFDDDESDDATRVIRRSYPSDRER